MFWTDGSIYWGMWYKGIQHGKGRMEFTDGTVKEGIFENNIFKGSIPNRLKLYQKRSCNSTSYYSFDKVTNSNSGLFESYSKQYQAMNYGEFNNKKRERNRHNDSFVKINLSSYNIPFMRTKMTTIYQSQKPVVMDTWYTDSTSNLKYREIHGKSNNFYS